MLFLARSLAILAIDLLVTASVVGLLVLLSNTMRFRPLTGFLIAPIAGSTLLAVCNPLLILGGMILGEIILWGDFSHLPSLPGVLSYYRYLFPFLGAPAAVLGVFIGLMVYTGTFLWRGAKRSRSRTVVGLLLLLLTWLVLGLGLTVEFLFLGAVAQ